MELENIIRLRQQLHQHPEVSNNEVQTSARISGFFHHLNPDEELDLGKTGKAFIFNGKEKGPVLVFRAELDALQINEVSDKPYQSQNKQVAHSCGHDGHMAIISGLGRRISINRPAKGKAVLLFQPAEELEQGAKDVVENPAFTALKPDYIFALHNIPGAEKHTVMVKNGSFAAASKGMTVKLIGKTSHAAEPEMGINPAMAISNIIQRLNQIKTKQDKFTDFVLLTIIHIRLGDVAFGTSPGYAEMMLTLRAFENSDMDLLTAEAVKIFKDVAIEENLGIEISFNEVFPATVNSKDCVDLIVEAADENKLQLEYLKAPFKWSEDFGYYTEKYEGGFFGLGAGKNQPALHNPDYDFPDDLIATGIDLFYSIYKKILQ